LLFHPGVASIRCKDCKKYDYDFDTGRRKKFAQGTQDRLRVTPPPCERKQGCPKGGPQEERSCQLTDANYATLLLFMANQSMAGGCLTNVERADSLVRRHFAILAPLYQEWRRRREADALAAAMMGR